MLLHHESDISGRFSFTTNVCLIPIILAGININDIVAGYMSAITNFIPSEFVQICINKSIAHNILFSYDNRLDFVNMWYTQIFAESLCTQDKFDIIPIGNIGTRDQHSVIEGYFANPKNKFVTFVSTNNQETLPMQIDISYIDGGSNMRSMSELKNHELFAIIATAKSLQLRMRHFEISLNEFDIAKLMMTLALEVLYIAKDLDINPFAQDMVALRKENSLKLLHKQ
jgi:glucose-6-phosphate isomerase